MVKFPAPARVLSLAQNNAGSGGIPAPNSGILVHLIPRAEKGWK
jgi:hypothetical protein